jgi:hypothetical protein
MQTTSTARYDAVIFDLLTALIDSWTLWNDVAGSEEAGMKWRKRYLDITYGARPLQRPACRCMLPMNWSAAGPN